MADLCTCNHQLQPHDRIAGVCLNPDVVVYDEYHCMSLDWLRDRVQELREKGSDE